MTTYTTILENWPIEIRAVPVNLTALGIALGLVFVACRYLLRRPGPVPVPTVRLELPKECQTVDQADEADKAPVLTGAGPDHIQCYDPATGRALGTVPITRSDEIPAMVESCRHAQTKWASSSYAERRRLLAAILDFVVSNQDVICRISARDSGKTYLDAQLGEILTTCEKLKWTMAYGEKALQPEYRETSSMLMYKHAIVEYLPLGVQGALVSWNYPFHNLMGPIITALFAGNGIVIKASEFVAWSASIYIDHLRRIIAAHGHNPNLVQLVLGYRETGKALVRSAVNHITFIGSTVVGREIMRNAAPRLTPTVLELGGKDCLILRHDCDPAQVAPLALRGVFQNCGQNCIGIERILVHTDVYDPFVKLVVDRVRQLKQGASLDEPGIDQGAMTMGLPHIARLEALVAEAVRDGAQLVTGGHSWNHPRYPRGTYFAPTVLTHVTPAMRISQEEHFGPLMVIMGPYADDTALVEVANACPFGLGGSIFTRDTAAGLALGRRLRTGMTNVNDFGANYLCQSLPFGGVNQSGVGRFAGYEGLRGVCLTKAMTVDRFPGVIQTAIPGILQYPVGNECVVNAFSRALVDLFYASAWRAKLAAVAVLTGLRRG
ncbi:Meiotic Sister-Chromatid recombination aldehyde dehydrogenase [Tieghemiomyces parasiticus]|uniref:Meiotic Sister-Chromatid recombination aldehyde dehydrogenase n=1 Tax=Tieghemiomyces parasiticus TaxID=78921 RepID=A0A9W8E2S7_9FUNG|nr:Meiotic Sister-Chromatid recombination aldehyde dehydrogenase [Tieghemiomyces parasiticus]